MSRPTPDDLFAVMEATWPPKSSRPLGPWTIRDGGGGGKRVSATTGDATSDIEMAEAEMVALAQPHLFMIRQRGAPLDQLLANRGYRIIDPVTLFCCPIQSLTAKSLPPLAGFAIWPPLAIMDEIWDAGGIDAARLAVMHRVQSNKTAIFGRTSDRAAGTAFVAIHRNVAMIHAIEVDPAHRRQGVGINIMHTATHWAQDQGARYFSLAVTDANLAAIALYKKLGMTAVGRYHYRMRRKTISNRGRM